MGPRADEEDQTPGQILLEPRQEIKTSVVKENTTPEVSVNIHKVHLMIRIAHLLKNDGQTSFPRHWGGVKGALPFDEYFKRILTEE